MKIWLLTLPLINKTMTADPRLSNLFAKAMKSEEDCLQYLQEFGLFTETCVPCLGARNESCGVHMRRRKRSYLQGSSMSIWQCPKRGCRTTRSIRKPISFSLLLTSTVMLRRILCFAIF